jgi:[protein-PII] uridylyltransferase
MIFRAPYLPAGTLLPCEVPVRREGSGALAILEGMRESLGRSRETQPVGEAPWEVLDRHTAVVDEIVAELYRMFGGALIDGGMALIAVGGYGRRELTPWSDVDLMFLCRDTSSQSLVQTIYRILHALWDLHLEVGHSVRTVEDCVEVSLRDIPTWTALMDARLVAGDEDLFATFRGRVRDELFLAEQEAFVKGLFRSIGERHRAFARAPFLVEPHLKEGPGGLRDYQSALWLARSRFPIRDPADLVQHALISDDELGEIQQAHAFLWKVRLELHRQAGRKEDQLTFGMQEIISQRLAVGEGTGLRVEAFMREYYRWTTRIRYFVEDMIPKVAAPPVTDGSEGPGLSPEELGPGFQVIRRRLTLVDEGALEADPPRMMEAIAYAHREGLEVDLFTRDEIKASLRLVDVGFRRSRRVRDAFLSVLDSADCGHKALELMHRVGLLQAYIPEFDQVCFQVQHDAYHAYTVDVHSLEAVRELAAIRATVKSKGDPLGKMAREIREWAGLALAVFLHDIGKGEGHGHAARGAQIVESILDRWWMPSQERERVLFLVREHITLMDTAMGRDLTDEKVIADLCRTVESVERLDDLYLMTLADLKATGPDLLTDWKDQLLRELYLKARHLLKTGDLVSPEATQKIREARERVRSALADRLDERTLERWVQGLSARYLLTTPPEDLMGQVAMALDMVDSGETLRVSHRARDGYHEIVVCTRDAPRLFSRICGILVAHGFNIMGARIHTWASGVVMDTFQVEPLGPSPSSVDADQLERMGKDLAAVLEGREDLREILTRRALPPLARPDRYPATRPRVRIDNRASDFYTVVEVRATDRFGLLFAITSTFAELGLSVHVALIDTRRGQVMDVFYVQDATGQKVWEEEQLASLERNLHRSLERVEASGMTASV